MLDKGLLTREEMSMQAIRRYLSEHPQEIREILNTNPSYIFFRPLKTGPVGNIGVPLTPGRSLALDSKRFPKGALAFISCQKTDPRSQRGNQGMEPVFPVSLSIRTPVGP